MKPLALFGIIVIVGLIAIVAGLRATDNSASAKQPPLSRLSAQVLFVRRGNGACARYYQEIEANFEGRSRPKTAKADAMWLRIGMPLIERLEGRLRALVPPRREARTYRHLLRLAGKQVNDAHLALHAFETGQLQRGLLIERHADHLDRRLNSLSRKLGLTICGLTGQQVYARYG